MAQLNTRKEKKNKTKQGNNSWPNKISEYTARNIPFSFFIFTQRSLFITNKKPSFPVSTLTNSSSPPLLINKTFFGATPQISLPIINESHPKNLSEQTRRKDRRSSEGKSLPI